MVRILAGALLSGALLDGGGGAWAAESPPPPLDTGADLLRYCEGSALDDPAVERDRTFCDGFIAGTGLLYLELVKAETIKPWACAKSEPTLSEAREAFVAWGRNHPQDLAGKPVDAFWRAMAATYPCKS
jgi:hypothetical protein